MKKKYSQPTIEIQVISYQSALCGSDTTVPVNNTPLNDGYIE